MSFTGDLPDEVATSFRQAARIAWDVETTGLDWKTDRLALCQVAAPSVGVAVVRITPDIPVRLAALLAEPTVEKVFHHAPFDLRFMTHRWRVDAQNVRCTKVASKILTPEAPNADHSLASLLRRHLNVTLDKGAVRTSDWLADELSPEQLTYATNDVIYLCDLMNCLQDLLRQTEMDGLYDRCCDFLPSRVEMELLDIPDVFAY